MSKKIAGNENKSKPDSRKPAATEVHDDDLQQVSGGLAANRVARPVDPDCISKL